MSRQLVQSQTTEIKFSDLNWFCKAGIIGGVITLALFIIGIITGFMYP